MRWPFGLVAVWSGCAVTAHPAFTPSDAMLPLAQVAVIAWDDEQNLSCVDIDGKSLKGGSGLNRIEVSPGLHRLVIQDRAGHQVAIDSLVEAGHCYLPASTNASLALSPPTLNVVTSETNNACKRAS